MAKKKKEAINLLPQEEFAASTVGRILTWLLSTFRMIVIATEMVVMAAFLSRFWLDARNSDLNDEIKQKSAVISSYKDVENNFRSAQNKLAVVAALNSLTTKNSLTNLVTGSLPSDIVLTSIAFTGTDLQIRGTGASEQSIAQFVANLTGQKSFSNISLAQIESDKNGNGLLFFIKASAKGGK